MTVAPNLSKRAAQRAVLGRIMRNKRRAGATVRALCLPGFSCWDVTFLLSFPWVSEVVALESDPGVAATVRAKTAGLPVVVHEESTTSFLARAAGKFDLIYLDYFANFGQRIEVDLSIVVRRRLLRERGVFAANFYGAREGEVTQARHQMLFDDLDGRYPSGESWATITPDRRRCVAFNALVASWRIRPTSLAAPGSADRYFVTTCVPKWHAYSTEKCRMLTGWFALNTYTKTPDRTATFKDLDAWYARGRHAPRTHAAANLRGLALSAAEGPNIVSDWWQARIAEFYRRECYTPSVSDIGATYVRGWSKHVRAVGLCPRTSATSAQIAAEVSRIAARDGVVTWRSLIRAKISKRPIFAKRPTQSAAALCDSIGVTHDFSDRRASSRPVA